jgi:hypothetical protein
MGYNKALLQRSPWDKAEAEKTGISGQLAQLKLVAYKKLVIWESCSV